MHEAKSHYLPHQFKKSMTEDASSSERELDIPDLMEEASCSSLSDSSVFNKSMGTSFYQSCNSSFNSSFVTCSSSFSGNHAFQNSGVFKKKQARAATKIQAVARTFVIRINICKAPILAELEDIQKRKQEELDRIELQKQAEMEAFRLEMELENSRLKEAVADAKSLMISLKAEKTKYEEENTKLKMQCKDLKKFNKELAKQGKKNSDKAIDSAMAQYRIDHLEKQNEKFQEAVDKLMKNATVFQGHLDEAQCQIQMEKRHTKRLKECISNIFDIVEPKSEHLTQRLLKITMKNDVFA